MDRFRLSSLEHVKIREAEDVWGREGRTVRAVQEEVTQDPPPGARPVWDPSALTEAFQEAAEACFICPQDHQMTDGIGSIGEREEEEEG